MEGGADGEKGSPCATGRLRGWGGSVCLWFARACSCNVVWFPLSGVALIFGVGLTTFRIMVFMFLPVSPCIAHGYLPICHKKEDVLLAI